MTHPTTPEAPARLHPEFSTSSPPASPVSTRPLSREPAPRRNPRTSPETGDRLELGAVVWRVLLVTEGAVTVLVEGTDEQRNITRAQWPRVTAGRAVIADAPKLLPNDLLALGALANARADEGARALEQASGLTHGTWQRTAKRLRALGLVLVDDRTKAHRYTITPAGRRSWADVGRSNGPVGRSGGPISPPLLPTEVGISPKEENIEQQATTQPRGPIGGLVGRRGPTDDLALVVMDRLAAAMERLADVLAVRSLSDRDMKPENVTAQRDPKPQNVDSEPAPDHPSPGCSCKLPMVLKTRREEGPRNGERFWSCSLWRSKAEPGCGETLTLDKARALHAKALEAAETATRAEQARTEREAKQKADDEAAVARVREQAEARRKARAGARSTGDPAPAQR